MCKHTELDIIIMLVCYFKKLCFLKLQATRFKQVKLLLKNDIIIYVTKYPKQLSQQYIFIFKYVLFGIRQSQTSVSLLNLNRNMYTKYI